MLYAQYLRPNSSDEQLRVLDIINNFKYLNFNIGPTLLSWLAANAPVTYERILAADRESQARLGFGNAIAQAYNHIILPLANARDRETEILWGLRDFSFRFQRQADAMWLPETAVNMEVFARPGQPWYELCHLVPLAGSPDSSLKRRPLAEC